ncbi:hypothetical protein RLEG3_03345 (plasmid) [Rhizobium leguminosarum bv. trifolii WSM1689]|nr:hypothetical protein RLEG3_03345 [Rhizobium leguminosarum bv. trifolii WSM1689]
MFGRIGEHPKAREVRESISVAFWKPNEDSRHGNFILRSYARIDGVGITKEV